MHGQQNIKTKITAVCHKCFYHSSLCHSTLLPWWWRQQLPTILDPTYAEIHGITS